MSTHPTPSQRMINREEAVQLVVMLATADGAAACAASFIHVHNVAVIRSPRTGRPIDLGLCTAEMSTEGRVASPSLILVVTPLSGAGLCRFRPAVDGRVLNHSERG